MTKYLHNDVIDGNMDKLHKVSNETHNQKTNRHYPRNLDEL